MNVTFLLNKWMQLADNKSIPKSNAMCLGTVDINGKPSSRMILISEIKNDSVIFFTDERSRKIIDLSTNPNASGLLYWPSLGRQIRLEGTVEKIDNSFAIDDFENKSREKQLIISLCKQSNQLNSYRGLKKKFVETFENLDESNKIYTPSFWNGYLLRITQIEYFKGGEERLNKRLLLFQGENKNWNYTYLFP